MFIPDFMPGEKLTPNQMRELIKEHGPVRYDKRNRKPNFCRFMFRVQKDFRLDSGQKIQFIESVFELAPPIARTFGYDRRKYRAMIAWWFLGRNGTRLNCPGKHVDLTPNQLNILRRYIPRRSRDGLKKDIAV